MPKTSQATVELPLPGELPQLARLLAESLYDDPLQGWLFPDAGGRQAASEQMFRRLLRPKLATGLIRIVRDEEGHVASAAVWTPPYSPTPTRWQRYAESFFMRMTYGNRIHEVRRGFTALAARHPREPYWYLQALATAPAERGHGYATQLVRDQIKRSAESGELIALETSQPANLAYYQKLGFEIADELLLAKNLPVWLMCLA